MPMVVMTSLHRVAGSLAAVLLAIGLSPQSAASEEMGIYALVNDLPITNHALKQRVNRLVRRSPAFRNRMKAVFADKKALNKRFIAYARKRKPKAFARLQQLQRSRPRTREEANALRAEAKKISASINALQKPFGASLQNSARAAVTPTVKREALRALVNDALKRKAIKDAGVGVSASRIDEYIQRVAQSNNTTVEKLYAQVKKSGQSKARYRRETRTRIAWNTVIRRRYGRQVSFAAAEVEQVLASAETTGSTELELELMRMTLQLGTPVTQGAMAQRFAAAENIRRSAQSCDQLRAAGTQVAQARVDALGKRKLSDVDASIRPLAATAAVGTVLPPVFSVRGVELYGICAKRTVASAKEREQAERTLRSQKLSSYGQRLLRDLCNDAVIEYRNGKPPAGGKPCG